MYQLINTIFRKIKQTKTKLSDLIDLSNGFKPYQVGYGKNFNGRPLTASDIANRIYHSDTKLGSTYKKQIKGKLKTSWNILILIETIFKLILPLQKVTFNLNLFI